MILTEKRPGVSYQYCNIPMSQYHVVVRVDPTIKNLILRVAGARGETPSDFVRRSILIELAKLSFLDELSKKALGVETTVSQNLRKKDGSHKPVTVGEPKQVTGLAVEVRQSRAFGKVKEE